MTLENHEHSNEQLQEEVKETLANPADFDTTIYEKPVLTEETKDEIERLNAEIKFRQSPTNEAIQQARENQIPGDEKLHEVSTKKAWYKRAGLALAFTAASIFGGAKESKATTTDAATNTIETIAPSDSLEKKAFQQTEIGETFDHLTLEGSIFLPQSDTTKEFEAFYFTNDGKQEHKIGAILEIMAKKGYHPANEQQLRAIYNQNKTAAPFNKRQLSSLIALTPVGSPDDARANERRILEKDGKIQVVLPENAVFPTRNATGLGKYETDHELPDDYGYIFYKDVETK